MKWMIVIFIIRKMETYQLVITLKIVSCAFRIGSKVITLPPPNRHHHFFSKFIFTDEDFEIMEQAFITNEGKFVNREEAFIIAKNAGQLLPRKEDGYQGDSLFSEDLW